MSQGFYGLADFTGLPVGVPKNPAPKKGKGKAYGGRLWAQALLRQMMAEREEELNSLRRRQLNQIRAATIVETLGKLEEDRVKSAAASSYAVLLSEL